MQRTYMRASIRQEHLHTLTWRSLAREQIGTTVWCWASCENSTGIFAWNLSNSKIPDSISSGSYQIQIEHCKPLPPTWYFRKKISEICTQGKGGTDTECKQVARLMMGKTDSNLSFDAMFKQRLSTCSSLPPAGRIAITPDWTMSGWEDFVLRWG